MTQINAEHRHTEKISEVLVEITKYEEILTRQKGEQEGIDETNAKGAVDAINKELLLVAEVNTALKERDGEETMEVAVPQLEYEDALKVNELLLAMSYT